MKVIDFIPRSLIEYLKLIRNKRKFPNCTILTSDLSTNALLGKNVSLGRNVYVEGNVTIGDHTYIHNDTMIVSGKIGKFCSIAFNCQIGMWEHPTNFISTSPRTYATSNIFGFSPIWEHSDPPTIGNDVWIGSNVVIFRNISIGDGAIIGAGSIVTKDVPAYAIVAGSPAKFLKYRFDEETVSFLNDFKWWDLPENELHDLKSVFQSGEQGAEKLMQLKRKNEI